MEFIATLLKDFSNFLNPSSTYVMTYSWLIVAAFSFISCFVGLLLSWRIYIKWEKNIFDLNKFTLKEITVESLCAVVTTTLLFVLKVVLLNVYSVFFISIFWAKIYMKLVGEGEKNMESRLAKFNREAEDV
jgi:hypothetical protein